MNFFLPFSLLFFALGAGNYTYTDATGAKSCVMNFAQDPKVPTRYIASGWAGSIVRVPVSGLYTAVDNRFTGQWMPISMGDLPSVAMAELGGEWSTTDDVLYVRYAGGPGMPLKFDERVAGVLVFSSTAIENVPGGPDPAG